MKESGFYKFTLPLERNLFDELSNSIDFEEVGKGRKGNHLVNLSDKGIPLVRTTTKYNIPAYNFSITHNSIIESILNVANHKTPFPLLSFNNALIEIYDQNYKKMKYHSDQCLDLDANSYIALFSCYERPDSVSRHVLRKLKIKSKTTAEEFEFSLDNNSVILFPLSTNTKFLHKIILDSAPNKKTSKPDNRWLGITFRKSKTFIQFKNNSAYFPDGKPLILANDIQQKEFYQLRGQENKNMGFVYPDIRYTLSIADTIMPKDS